MHALLYIYIDDVDGHIQVSAEEIIEEDKIKVGFLLEKGTSIIELLEPSLNTVWNANSRIITPKHVVVKLEEINKACVELYCHFLDRDWPLIQLNISSLGDISEWDALKMAASYYKHLDRHIPPLFTQSLPMFPQDKYSPYVQKILECSGGNLRAQTLALKYAEVSEVGCANLLFLLRRFPTETLRIYGKCDMAVMTELLPGLGDIPLSKLRLPNIPAEHISLLSNVIWQNPWLVEVEFSERLNIATLLKLDSTAHFFPLETPECHLSQSNTRSADWAISFAMEALQSRHVVYNRNKGHWNDWVERCPSLIQATRLDCLLQNILHVGDTLTQLERLTLLQFSEEEEVTQTVLPPHIHSLKLAYSVSVQSGWRHAFVFPPYLRKLELETYPGEIDDELPIDVLLKPLTTCLEHLQKFKVEGTLHPARGEFPDWSCWPNLAYLTLELATVELAHHILASVPTTQWRGLNLMVLDDDPDREGMFKGLEDADWRLKQVGMHYVDFVKHADMLKHFHGLVKLTVKHVPLDSSLWPRLKEVLNPNSHTQLQTIRCYHEMDSTCLENEVEVSKDELAWLLTWPTLIHFTHSNKYLPSWWNRIRQSKLVDLAAHPLKLTH